jgi:lipopolysaccharide export LptBFGC system permease protein LptF
MLKSLSYVLVFLLLNACTSKEEKALIKVYEKNKTYHKQLQKTEKIQLKQEGITKVLLTATYLYDAKKKNGDEVFIVGFYAEESDIQSFTKEGFSLVLNGKKAKSIKRLEQGSQELKDISFVSEWSTFYLVHFPHTSQKKFKLTLSSDSYGRGSLHFAKVAKYVYTKKGF